MFNMNVKKTLLSLSLCKICTYAVFLCVTLHFVSCLEDPYWGDDGWDDYRIERNVVGQWYVNDISYAYGECPYRRNDEFYFYARNLFEVFGGGGYYEKGIWFVADRRIFFDFDNDGLKDMEAKVSRMSSDYMLLDIRDYYYGSRYSLELWRFY